MPRGGRSRPMTSQRSYSSSGYSPRPATSPPPPTRSSPQHPGLMKQAAATAGGVVAGNLIAGALMGPRTTVVVTEQQQQQPAEQKPQDPCSKQVQDLLNCIQMIQQTNENISICEGFRLKLAECRKQYGDPYGGQGQ